MPSAHYSCPTCHKRYATHRNLFETLYELQKTHPEDCPACHAPRELHLNLDFQLGCGDGDFTVVSTFLPNKLDSWLGEEEEEVTFYPFLVVLERTGDRKQFCWMPYWHVTGKEARYGQHAVCMDQAQLNSLMVQLRERSSERVLEFV